MLGLVCEHQDRLTGHPGARRTSDLPLDPRGSLWSTRPKVIIVRPRGAIADLVRADCALFARVAHGHTPWLDRVLPLLSRTANNSRLWMAVAGGLAVGDGRRGKRAALRGL